jgi:DNA invertase Pin-like site-specific DNA recombinase
MDTSNKKDPKLAVGYIRTETGRGRMKMREQLTLITTAARDRGLSVIHCYIEAGIQHFHVLIDMLNDAEKNNWSAVIVSDRDRLDERPGAYAKIEAELKQKGVEIIVVNPEPLIEDINQK